MTSARVIVELEADERAAVADAFARREARRVRRPRLIVGGGLLALAAGLALGGGWGAGAACATGAGAVLLVRAFLDDRVRWRRWFEATLGEGTHVFEWTDEALEIQGPAGPLPRPAGGWTIEALPGGWLAREGRRPAWFLPADCVAAKDPTLRRHLGLPTPHDG